MNTLFQFPIDSKWTKCLDCLEAVLFHSHCCWWKNCHCYFTQMFKCPAIRRRVHQNTRIARLSIYALLTLWYVGHMPPENNRIIADLQYSSLSSLRSTTRPLLCLLTSFPSRWIHRPCFDWSKAVNRLSCMNVNYGGHPAECVWRERLVQCLPTYADTVSLVRIAPS